MRSTFYNHFENIPDMLNTMDERIMQEIFDMMTGFRAENNYDICYHFFLSLCNYTKENRYLEQMIRTPNVSNSFMEKALSMLHESLAVMTERKAAQVKNSNALSFGIACSMGACIGVLHKWSWEKCKTPAEDVAGILTKTFMTCVVPYLEN